MTLLPYPVDGPDRGAVPKLIVSLTATVLRLGVLRLCPPFPVSPCRCSVKIVEDLTLPRCCSSRTAFFQVSRRGGAANTLLILLDMSVSKDLASAASRRTCSAQPLLKRLLLVLHHPSASPPCRRFATHRRLAYKMPSRRRGLHSPVQHPLSATATYRSRSSSSLSSSSPRRHTKPT